MQITIGLPLALFILLTACGGANDTTETAPPGEIDPLPIETNACNDGIDNDGDGLTDWQYDVGCYGPEDQSEMAGTRDLENGWTTFDLSHDSKVIYVSSSEGSDINDGLSPETAVASVSQARQLLRDGYPDFVLFKRGDTWHEEYLTNLTQVSGALTYLRGRSAEEKMVFGSYGESIERPRFEISNHFFNDGGKPSGYLAFSGLAFISYKKEYGAAEFDGSSGGALYFGATVTRVPHILIEDVYVKYGELILKNTDTLELRRNIVYRSYHMGTCSFDSNGNRTRAGDGSYKPSGAYIERSSNVLLEGNLWDGNGWNEDIPIGDASNPGPCATIYNHNIYIVDLVDAVITEDIYLRASSQGIKVSGGITDGETGYFGTTGQRNAIDNLTIENNLFAEGEIGISMVGNGNDANTHINSNIINNVITDIGRSKPTTRDLAWGITIGRNTNVLYEHNLLINPLENAAQAEAFIFETPDTANVTVADNVAYGWAAGIRLQNPSNWAGNVIENNIFHSTQTVGDLATNLGDFSDVTFRNNQYYSARPSDIWFYYGSTRISLSDWIIASGETTATESTYAPSDAGRNVDSYARYLGIGSTLEDFANLALQQSRLNWKPELTAKPVNAYIREGY